MPHKLFTNEEQLLLKRALIWHIHNVSDSISSLSSSATTKDEWDVLKQVCASQSECFDLLEKDFNFNVHVSQSALMVEIIDEYLENAEIAVDATCFLLYEILGKFKVFTYFLRS
jgi:hypothetical protein